MQKRLDFGAGSQQASGALAQWFHPAVAGWFESHFKTPTEVQAQAWAVTTQHRNALIAAPTGSGKTLAAFLSAINDLVVEGLGPGLTDEVHVLYVSPLKALSNDIQKNLQEPLQGIRSKLAELGYPAVGIRDAVRTGDTSAFERERMRRSPPHILVTTPESLFILLTSDSGRAMLSRVRSVIVDELHAVAGSKRGSHLMLSLERLCALCCEAGRDEPLRIGLSATQKPIGEMADFLMGQRSLLVSGKQVPSPPFTGERVRERGCLPERDALSPSPSPAGGRAEGELGCAVIDTGHIRNRDLAIEVPRSPLDAVMANEVWSELYERLAELIQQHRTTLIFVNTRRLAERAARHLAERLGEEHVTAHHGSLAKEHRLQAEQRLKEGKLKALVATSSLELGIDIGDIDLVCQMGSPRTIAALLQRVGRSGHAVDALPKGRLFPLSLDDLVECSALLDSVKRGELDRILVPRKPLDVLAQQLVAEVGCREWDVGALFETFCRAAPYRDLTRAEFDPVVQMLAEGFSTRRGRRSAHIHYDAVNGKLRGRRGARLTAVTNAGVIPDQFDYEVVLTPEGHRIGTIGEDFAFESIPGDIFQLGNASYRILKIETGKLYVEDAKGQPPSIPFWFGEAPGRSDELSLSVSRLRESVAHELEQGFDACDHWLAQQLGLPPPAAGQLTQYLAAAKAALSVLPTHDTLVLERFFDEAGDTHLVIHSPYGSRLNRALGLALRKRFCRQFNFELQASALEDSIVLSLGPSHSFPLEEIRDYLKSATVREVLIQALLDAPMFGARWRWNASIALAIRRNRNGQRVAPQLQRMDAEDLLTVVFPDQLACAENRTAGYREIPDHPLVQQTIHDCLYQTMDIDGLEALLKRIEQGEVRIVTRELTSPSPLAGAILSARPYAFLDDGDAENRRTQAVQTRRLLDPQDAADLGRLDPEAIARVCEEAWPDVSSPDELHDALIVHGFLTPVEMDGAGSVFLEALRPQRRVVRVRFANTEVWVATERLHEFIAAFPGMQTEIQPISTATPAAEDALREILRSRLELLGPVTEAQLGASLGLAAEAVRAALLQLEVEGAVMRGPFSRPPGSLPPFGGEPVGGPNMRAPAPFAPEGREWCDRRLLARIHRYTREKLRAEIQPVAPAQFMRYLFRWHQLPLPGADERREGDAGLTAVLQQLEGFPVPAAAWEEDLLPARIRHYLPHMLDRLCAAGRTVWTRPAVRGSAEPKRKSGPVRATPIMLCEREHLSHWQQAAQTPEQESPELSARAQKMLDALRTHGASFMSDLVHDTGLLRAEAEQALGELVSHGLVTSDSFAGLRSLTTPSHKRSRLRQRRAGADEAGRWALTRRPRRAADNPAALAAPHVEHIARVLLRRYGVVFRKLLEREDNLPSWRDLFYVYRRMEARGEIRGGRFVSGFSGEQFALTEAVAALRKTTKAEAEELVSISAADPLNLVGILLPGERVPALSGNRVLFRNGVAVAVQAGGEVRYLQPVDAKSEWEIRNLLIRKQKPASYFDLPQSPH